MESNNEQTKNKTSSHLNCIDNLSDIINLKKQNQEACSPRMTCRHNNNNNNRDMMNEGMSFESFSSSSSSSFTSTHSNISDEIKSILDKKILLSIESMTKILKEHQLDIYCSSEDDNENENENSFSFLSLSNYSLASTDDVKCPLNNVRQILNKNDDFYEKILTRRNDSLFSSKSSVYVKSLDSTSTLVTTSTSTSRSSSYSSLDTLDLNESKKQVKYKGKKNNFNSASDLEWEPILDNEKKIFGPCLNSNDHFTLDTNTSTQVMMNALKLTHVASLSDTNFTYDYESDSSSMQVSSSLASLASSYSSLAYPSQSILSSNHLNNLECLNLNEQAFHLEKANILDQVEVSPLLFAVVEENNFVEAKEHFIISNQKSVEQNDQNGLKSKAKQVKVHQDLDNDLKYVLVLFDKEKNEKQRQQTPYKSISSVSSSSFKINLSKTPNAPNFQDSSSNTIAINSLKVRSQPHTQSQSQQHDKTYSVSIRMKIKGY